MKKNLIATLPAVLGLMGVATSAHAGLILLDAPASTMTISSVSTLNDFRIKLGNLGVDSYTLGASLGLNEAGTVSYYYYGKEAGYRNDFQTNDVSFSSDFTPQTQDLFAAPEFIGSVEAGPGLLQLDFTFCAYAGGPTQQGCLSNGANALTGVNPWQSIGMTIVGNSAWLLWDDSGAGPDDDYDDMLIRAEFKPSSVPEPGTLALLGIGLVGAMMGAQRRRQKA